MAKRHSRQTMPPTAAAATRNKIASGNGRPARPPYPLKAIRRTESAHMTSSTLQTIDQAGGGVDLPVRYLYNVFYDRKEALSEDGEGEGRMAWSVSGRLIRSMAALSGLTVFLSVAPGWAAQGRIAGPNCDGRADFIVAGRTGDRAPYGISEGGEYGQKREVASPDQARKILEEYFSKKDVRIGKITEKNLYFEAEIRDRNGKLVDTVIVDKRTGRIRSIY